MAIEIVNFPIKHGGSFHSLCKRLPEGNKQKTSKNPIDIVNKRYQPRNS